MIVKILSNTSYEKGKLFEELMGDVLDSQGYTDLEFRQITSTGEFDITGRHRFSGQEILVECKAESSPIGKPKLKDFHSKYTIEYENREGDLPLLGIFFSLSGFTTPASRYYEGMHEGTKKRFRIFGHQDILDVLKALRQTCSEETIRQFVAKSLPYTITKCYLAKSPSGLHWVILFSAGDEETHYTILDVKGDMAVRRIYEEIGKLDDELKGKEMINLQARRKVVLCLSDGNAKAKEHIAQDLNESIADVELELGRLHNEDICDTQGSEEAKSYNLRKDILTFAQLTRELLDTEVKDEFVNSEYYCAMIDDRLVNYVVGRLRLSITDKDKNDLLRIMMLSPAALMYCLHGSMAFFDQSWKDMQQQKLSEPEQARFHGVRYSRLLTDLVVRLLYETYKYDRLGIRSMSMEIRLRMASLRERYLDIVSGGIYHFVHAQGNLQAGQMVSFLTPDADQGLALFHLGQFQLAIERFDVALNNTQSSEEKAAIMNNKGLALCRLCQHEKAIKCYGKAIQLDPKNQMTVLSLRRNKGLCFFHLQQYAEALEWGRKAEEIDSDWDPVKSFIIEVKAKLEESSQSGN